MSLYDDECIGCRAPTPSTKAYTRMRSYWGRVLTAPVCPACVGPYRDHAPDLVDSRVRDRQRALRRAALEFEP